MTIPLRGAVAGFGRMGMTHYSILNCHPDVEFVAVCDPSSFIRNKVEKHLGVETFSDHGDMIRQTSPNFVLIATPTGTHTACALEAIDNGVHMFMEKPLAVTPEDGEQIINALSARPVVNQVGYVMRFNDIFLAVKKLLDSQQLGDLISFKAEVKGPTILRDVKEGWRATKSQGGGCLHDFASHAVDLVCYLFGVPNQAVGSVLQSIYSSSVDDAVHSTLIYNRGAVGTIQANWSDASFRKPTYNLEVLCKGGRILADMHQFKVFFRNDPESVRYRKGWTTVYVTDIAEPVRFYLRGYEFTRQLDYFVSQVSAGATNNISSFLDAHTTDRAIDMISTNAKSCVSENG